MGLPPGAFPRAPRRPSRRPAPLLQAGRRGIAGAGGPGPRVYPWPVPARAVAQRAALAAACASLRGVASHVGRSEACGNGRHGRGPKQPPRCGTSLIDPCGKAPRCAGSAPEATGRDHRSTPPSRNLGQSRQIEGRARCVQGSFGRRLQAAGGLYGNRLRTYCSTSCASAFDRGDGPSCEPVCGCRCSGNPL